MKWHSFIEKIMPQGTRRRRYYDLHIIGLRTIVNEGFGCFLWKYRQHKSLKKLDVQQKKEEEISKVFYLKDWTGEKLIFSKSPKNPDVSIIIPVYNNAKYTFNCLKSVYENTRGSFEMILVDDCSTDETYRMLKDMKNIKIVRNEKNLGFVESCNIGAKASTGKYLFFLNNDAIVTQNWLEPLIETIEREKVGAVGAKLVYPDGKLQEAGGIIWNDASGWNYGRYDDPDKPEYNFVREVDYCSGAALFVRRDLFENLDGFDRRFKPGYYEDVDLCFSIRKLGYKVLYQPKSVIIHFEGITGGTDITSGVKRYQEVNKSKFFAKLRNVLENEHYGPNADLLFSARDRRKGKNILVIDHYVPTFDKDAGSYMAYNLLRILTELGHKVTFIGDNLARLEPYTSIIQQLGVEVIYAPYIKSIEEYLKKNGEFFDIAILTRAHIAANHISSVKKYCNKAKIVFDTVDLQFLREMRRANVEKNEKVLKETEKLKKLELQLARLSDVTLVVSPVEKAIMMKEEPSLRIKVISNIHIIKQPKKR
ncbi:glycosyltransferase, partial [bacterium]|nr:glycosyltransferase [bacterium]